MLLLAVQGLKRRILPSDVTARTRFDQIEILRRVLTKNQSFTTMGESSEAKTEPVGASPALAARPQRPVSEALLNDKWDHALSSLLVRSSIGLSFGIVFSVLLFKRRAWPAWTGLGFGAGRAWEEADGGSYLTSGSLGSN